jgi:hypothetical protein
MICTIKRHWTKLVQVFVQIQIGESPSMEKRILRLKDDFWRIRTDTGELADAERNALRAYLDEKRFKTAIIDDNLAVAGELTWQEIVEPVEAFYKGKADVYPF